MIDVYCTAQEAVKRALDVVASRAGQYQLGTGDYNPRLATLPRTCQCCGQSVPGATVDQPWTQNGGPLGSDCTGFAICYCWKVRRHRPGFAKGFPPQLDQSFDDVDDDVNCNSLIEDALGAKSLCVEMTGTANMSPGDLLVYPSITLSGKHFIGHVGIVVAVSAGYTVGAYGKLSVAQCHGPNGFTPGAVVTDGSVWQHHDTIWPKPEHHTRVIRMKERS